MPNLKHIHYFFNTLAIISIFLFVGVYNCQCKENSGYFTDQKIVDIKYKCDGIFSEDRVRSLTVIKVGDLYSRSLVRKSIENIFAIGGFDNIEVDTQPKDDGIELTFILFNQIKIRSIQINGNKRLSKDEIMEVLRIRPEYEYNQSFVEAEIRSIRELYKLYGYMNANISFSVNIDSKINEADIAFSINEGVQPIISEIIFTGTNEAVVSTKNLLKAMKDIKLGWIYKGQRILDLDVKRIENMYREKEYLTAKVKSARALSDPSEIQKYSGIGRHFIAEGIEESDLKSGTVVILVEIEQGKRVYIKIRGNKNISNKDIKKAIALNRMRSVNESVVRRSRDDIMKLYKTYGFYLVNVNYEILKDKIWDFDKNDDADGWEILKPYDEFNISSGLLEIKNGANLQLSDISIDPNIYQKAQIRIRVRTDTVDENNNANGKLYWTTNKSEKWNQKKSLGFASKIIIDNQFHDYEILLYKNKRWSDTIDRLRFVLLDKPNFNIDVEWIKLSTEFTPIVFNIAENRQMRVKKPISIATIDSKTPTLDESLIRKQILTRKKSLFSFWILKRYFPTGILDEDVFAEDLRAIQALYKDNGFTNPMVESEKNIKPEKGEIDIGVKINEGARTFVHEVIIEGNKDDVISPNELFSRLNVIQRFSSQNIISDSSILRYRANDPKPYREYDIAADRSFLSLYYADKGYLAEIEPNKQFNDDLTSAIIAYKITPGNLIRLDGNIEIQGNTRTKRSIIEKELSSTLVKDRIFSFSEMEKSAQRIRDIGIFESVNPEPQQVIGSDDQYRLLINVKERKARSLNFRAGYTSLEDFQGGIEASDINLWGRAHKISTKAQLGTQGKGIEAEYNVPKIFPGLRRSDVLGLINVYPYSQYIDKDYNEIRKGGTAGISWNFLSKNNLKLDYRYDVLEYNLYGKDEVTKIGRFEVTSQRDGRDNLLNPKSGTFYVLSLEYANPYLGGFETFTKLSLNSMFYARLFRNVVFGLGLRTGYAWGLGGTDKVLAPELFKMRDYQIPRGYKWETKDIGDALLNTSSEIRFPLYKWIGLAIFFDSGHVYNGISDFDINDMQSSVGLGLRIITPIGPIRLDYGYPIRGNGKRNYWPDFAFGNPF